MAIEARTINYSLAKYARGSKDWDVGVNSNFDKIDLQMKTNADKIADLEGAAIAVPTGAVFPYAGISIPSGYFECNGASLLRADYPGLFSSIGTTYGASDANHFNLPDLRDRYPRGKSSTLNLGDEQEDALQGHWHKLYHAIPFGVAAGGNGAVDHIEYGMEATQPWNYNRAKEPISDGTNGTPRVADETRPKTLVLTFIIKY